jgi:hypothetical protein
MGRPRVETPRVRLDLRVKPQLKAALKKLADEDRRDLSPYCEIVLERHVETLEESEKRLVKTGKIAKPTLQGNEKKGEKRTA